MVGEATVYDTRTVYDKAGGGIISTNFNLYSKYFSTKEKGFYTENFDLVSAQVIEENIVFKNTAWTPNESFTIAGGQWYTGDMSVFNGLAVYLLLDKIEIDWKENTPGHYDFINDIHFDFNYLVRKNIIYDKVTDVTTCKIYYDDVLVCTYTRNTSDLNFYVAPYGIMSNRKEGLMDIGYIDLKQSYIKLDNQLVWGIEQ